MTDFKAAALAAAIMLGACATPVSTSPAQFVPLHAGVEIQLRQKTVVKLATGYSRELPAGSRWRAVGTVAQGTVYGPLGTVFSIEGRQVHEAYLVVKDGALVGFYLPAELSFSPLTPSLQLSLGAPS